jgi:PhzF family phenazine biosynthesis protein
LASSQAVIVIENRIFMPANYFVIDTFTTTPFKGNPTGVCVTPRTLNNDLMLSVARELNFPVTAFVERNAKGKSSYPIKYFTPTTEIPACGHATLASAKVVFELDSITAAVFTTIENLAIEIGLEDDLIVLSYPVYLMEETEVSQELIRSIGLFDFKSSGYCKELQTLFLELENPSIVKSLQPDFKRLVNSSDIIKEVVITSVSDIAGYDYLLRSFCPWIGIDEDPVTGSVHSVLAGFWKTRLKKTKLKAFQCSERGGELFVTAYNDKVELGGKTITILEGEISL